MRKMCSKAGGPLARDIPWLYLIWHDRDREAGRFPGKGSCTEKADCQLDTCKEDGGVRGSISSSLTCCRV